MPSTMPISRSAFDEIKSKLESFGRGDLILSGGSMIDLGAIQVWPSEECRSLIYEAIIIENFGKRAVEEIVRKAEAKEISVMDAVRSAMALCRVASAPPPVIDPAVKAAATEKPVVSIAYAIRKVTPEDFKCRCQSDEDRRRHIELVSRDHTFAEAV